MKSLPYLILSISAILAAPSVSAEPVRVELGLGLGSGKSSSVGSVLGLTPELEIAVPIDPRMAIVADWGLTWVTSDAPPDEEKTAIALQNPFLGLEMIARGNDGGFVKFRPGLALPVASLKDDEAPGRATQGAAFNLGRGTFGMRDLWKSVPENVALVGTVELSGGRGELGLFGMWLDTAFLFPTSDADPDGDWVVESGFWWRIGPFFVDLAAVWIPTNDGDNAQVSVRPGFSFGLGGSRVEIAATLNLDDPFASFGGDGVIGGELRFAFGLGGGEGGDDPGPRWDPEPPDPPKPPDPPSPPSPPSPPGPPRPPPSTFEAAFARVIEAFPERFDAIKGAEVKDEGAIATFGTYWQSNVCLPDAEECKLYLGALARRPKFIATMPATVDESEATAAYEKLTDLVNKARLGFSLVRLEERKSDALWSQSYVPLTDDARWEGLVIEVERVSNPLTKIGDSFGKGWFVVLRVDYVPTDD